MDGSIGAGVDCVFCGILAGGVAASFVHEDGLTVAFLDIRPIARGHALVVPRRHLTRLEETDDREGPAIWSAAQRIAGAARQALGASGVNLLLADGETAGQDVAHLHLHVVPRYGRDELRFEVRAWAAPAPERAALDDTAALMAAALRDVPP